MKKLFSVIAAGAVIFTASAAFISLNTDKAEGLRTDVLTTKKARTAALSNTHERASVDVRSLSQKKVKGIRKADGQTSLEGTWTFYFGDYYFQDSSLSTLEAEYTATVSGTTVSFDTEDGDYLPFVGQYDEATSTITFSRQFLGTSGSYYIFQEPFIYNYDTNKRDSKDLVGTYDGTSQISFPADSGLSWTAYSSAAGTSALGYFGIYDFEGANRSADWKVMENGKFNENVIYGTFQGAENKTISDVQVLESPYTPGIYKVINPFGALYSELGFQGTSPTMLIDATDPANVKVEMQSTGISGGASVGTYYYFNEGWYCDEFGEDLDPSLICTKVTEGNQITITFPYHSFTLYAGTSGSFYYGSAYESVLTFTDPSIEEPWTPGEDDYVVYNNGVLNPDLKVYGWWNDVANFKAPNPSGSGEAYEFKAADGGAAASMGLNMEAPQNTGMLHSATLNFNWYATTAATYTIRLTSVAEQDYKFTPTEDQLNKWNTTSLNVAEVFPAVAADWDANKNLGVGYVFSVIMDNGTEGSVIYFDKVYYSNVDTEWEAPVVVIPTPENVPAPTQPSENVFSFFSNYGNNVNYNIGGWGQTTQSETIQVDGKDIIRLRNFNYLGWVDFNINISDYDYMHVDYWTPDEEAVFGFVPISLNPTVDTPIWEAPEVKANQWNSYDAPLSSFGADMTKIEQIKFVANLNGKVNSEYGYIANVYFYKESKGGAEVSGTLTTQTDMNMGMGEEPDLLPVDTYSVTAAYNQTANTITLSNYKEVSEDVSSGLEGLNPLQLTIDIEKGTVIATGEQASSVDDWDPEEPQTYYYMDIQNEDYGVSGTIANLNENQCVIKLNPWGEGDMFPGFGFFTINAYYNTEIVLDLNIEGLAYAPQASIDNLNVKADGDDLNLTIEYTTSNVPEGSKVYAEIFDVLTGEEVPVFGAPIELVQNPTVVRIPNATYVDGQVASHNYRVVLVVKDSEGETVVTATKETGITTSVEGIQVEGENQVRYYNMQGVEVAEPSNGVFIKVEGTKKTKVLVK